MPLKSVEGETNKSLYTHFLIYKFLLTGQHPGED